MAEKLSVAQRRVLLCYTFDDEDGGRIVRYDANTHAAYELNRLGLCDDFFYLTKLGLAVHRLLVSEVLP